MNTNADSIILRDIFRKGMSYIVFFSNGEEIKTTKNAIDRHCLTAGLVFSEHEYKQIKIALKTAFAYYSAEEILSRRAHSVGEFKLKLRRKEIEENLIKKIVADFRKRNLLDDYAYGTLRAQSVLNRKPAGRGYLIGDLQNKLVPRKIAEEVIDDVLKDVDEVASAITLLKKRETSFRKFDLETARRKAYNYLLRRSISYGAAKEAFDTVFKSEHFTQGR